MAVGFGQHQ